MQRAIFTFAWATWRQHRIGLALAVSVLVLAAVATPILAFMERRPEFVRTTGFLVALESIVVFFAAVMCLLSVFSYSDFQADIIGRASGFPPNILRLPVRTLAMVAWPIAYGAVLPAALWIGIVLLLIRPWEGDFNPTPMWWPAALGTACIAWVQALHWAPFPTRGMRIFLVILVEGGLIELAIKMSTENVPQGARTAALGGLAALGWSTAFFAVRETRLGRMPDWEQLLARRSPTSGRRTWRPFGSAARSLDWLEWWVWGANLPLIVGVVLPVIFAPFFLYSETFLWQLALMAPLGLAGFAGGWAGGGKSPWMKDRAGLATTIATAPIPDDAIVRSKIKTATYSALLTWLVTVSSLTIMAVLVLTMGTGRARRELLDATNDLFAAGNTTEKGYMAGSFAIALLVWTWKRTLNSHFNGLFGRQWILGEVGMWVLLYSGFIITVGLLFRANPETALARIAAGVIVWRIIAAGAALGVGLAQNLLSYRTAAVSLVIWLFVAGSLIATFERALPFHEARSPFVVVGWVLFIMPTVRLAALPLAVARVRHR
jgi:hypothetical protein